MNLLSRFLLVGTLLTAAPSFAADGFEGKVTFAMTSGKGRTMNMDYAIKGPLVRMDMNAEGQAVSMIMNPEKREITNVMHEQHMYMVMPMQLPPAAEAKVKEMTANPDVEKTGKTETILGYLCSQVLVKDSKGATTEMWLAEGLGTFMSMGGNPFGGKSSGPSKWEQALKGIGGFPMRVVTHDAAGKESYKMEVTKIAPGPQPAADFQPPAGFQKLDMGGMNPFAR
jgi:hypothetical protein